MSAGIPLLGDGLEVPCLDGSSRPYLGLDAAASTPAMVAVADEVAAFLPWYSSVHRGAGYKSQLATSSYESARKAILEFAGRAGTDDIAIICRNTTEAINHLAYRLDLPPGSVVATTVVEHHANLLPWARVATRRFVECGPDGTFDLEAVIAVLDERPTPRLLAITGASNVTGWSPPLDGAITAAHDRGVPVLVDGAQLAAHRPLPQADFVVFSGHKTYAPFGAGVLIGPRSAFARGDPFLAGGGAVELVDLDEVVWSDPPEREEAGSPNVVGAVALGSAVRALGEMGWAAVSSHDDALSTALHDAIARRPALRLLGAGLPVLKESAGGAALPLATFVVEDVPHGLVAARLSAEFGIGVRHGCFCAHPYIVRLLGLDKADVARFREAALHRRRELLPGAVRVSASLSTSLGDIERLFSAVDEIVSTPPPVPYERDADTGDYWPAGFARPDQPARSRPGCAAT